MRSQAVAAWRGSRCRWRPSGQTLGVDSVAGGSRAWNIPGFVGDTESVVGTPGTRDPKLDPLLQRIAELEAQVRNLKNEAFVRGTNDTYRSILEYSPVPLWISCDNRIVFVNSAAVRLLGSESAEDLIGRSPLDFIHPDYHALVESRRKHVTQMGRQVPPVEEQIVRLDGGIVDVEATTRAFPFEGGTALIANFVDLTERKRWEQVVRISRERLDLVIAAVDLGLFYCDLPFDRLLWNARCKEHFGLPDGVEVTIETFYERLHPDDRARTREAIDSTIAGHGPYDIQYRTIGLDGNERWIRAIGRCFYDGTGTPRRFDGVTLDITEQKHIEAALRHNEERYRELLKREASARNTAEMLNRVGPLLAAELDLSRLIQAATDIATAVTNSEYGAFFYHTDGAAGEEHVLYALSGAPRERFAGIKVTKVAELFAGAFHGEAAMRIHDARVEEAFAQDPVFRSCLEGGIAGASYLAVPVISRSGEVLGAMIFAHSEPGSFTAEHERIAAGIAAQAAIAIDNARLFEQVNRERDKAEAAQRALEVSNAELQQFAYVASHDLQEPLRTISSFTQLLERRLAGRLDQEASEFMDFVVSGAQRMSEVIQDLLAYSRLQNSAPAPLRTVSMNDVLAQTLETLRASIQDSRAEITSEDLPQVRGDELQLAQVLQNLIANAIKYRSEATPRIHVSASRQGNDCTIRVADNGIGIDPVYYDRIFGIFKRLHGKDVPGTGIGLAICKRIVEGHNGHIWVESRIGEGSTFCFTLRCA